MADNFILKVTPKDLTDTAGKFENKAADVQKKTDAMLTLINGIGGAVWSGDAQKAYKKQFKKLDGDMLQMYNKIKEHVDDLKEIASNYESAESQISSTVKALQTDVIS